MPSLKSRRPRRPFGRGPGGTAAPGSDSAGLAGLDKLAPGSAMQAERLAYVFLARRDHSAAELSDRLARKGFEPAVVAPVVAGLLERGYLDDARFAAHYVTAHVGRGQGPLRIRRELEDLGVAAEVIAAALEGGADWPALARDLRARRFGREPPASWPEKARQGRFLQYRGFSPDHIRSALEADDIDLPSSP